MIISIFEHIKNLRGFHDLMREDGDPHDIIPHDSCWVFRWGYQSIRAVRSYRKMEVLYKQGFENGSDEIKEAKEQYAEAQFACQFGQPEKKAYRDYIKEVEAAEIDKSELRILVYNKDIQGIEEDKIHIRESTTSTLVGGIYMFLCVTAFLLFLAMIFFSPAILILKIFLLFISCLVFFGCGFSVYLTVVKPFFIAKRLKQNLKTVWFNLQKKNNPVELSIVPSF